MRRLLDLSLAHPRTVLVLWGLATLAAGLGLARLETDNSPDVYIVRSSDSYADFLELRESFGGGEQVRLAVTGDDLWTPAGQARLASLEERAAREVPHVGEVVGLIGRFRVGSAEGREPPTDLAQRAVEDPIARGLGLVGEGGGTATVLLGVDPPDNRAQEEVVVALEELAREASRQDAAAGLDLATKVVGIPVLDRALDASSREIGEKFFPLLVVLATLLLMVSFRTVRGVVVPLVFVAVPEAILLGTLGHLGVHLNLVLAILPPLLFVISLATAVHLLVAYRDRLDPMTSGGLTGSQAVRATFDDKGWAVFWTGVTTFVGFASLSVSDVGPVRTLGVASGVGIALMTLAAFTLYPALLTLFGDRAGRREWEERRRGRALERWLRHRGGRWARWAVERRRWALGGAGLLALLALAGLPRLATESNALTFLPDDHPARSGLLELESRGIASASAELLLTLSPPGRETEDSWRTPDRLRRLEELSRKLAAGSRVLATLSAGELYVEARSAAGVPAGPFADRLALGALEGDPEAGRLLDAFVTPDGRRARIALAVRTLGHEDLEPVFARAEALASQAFPEAAVAVTGEFPLLLETHSQLLRTLGLSLTLTLLAVGLILRLLLPSTRLALLALVPNLWPVAGVVGLMGWAGVPLDTATVMVASVVLGLAVDDTIHTLGHFRELAPVVGRVEAVVGTLEKTAPAYVLTGVILTLGFGVCALSDFAPTARFGMLAAVAIALAVLGDLFLLPALLGSTPREVVKRL